MNKVILMGRLTKDPDVREAKEVKVAKFSLAVDRRFKDKETDFFNCTAFGKQADFVEKYLTKGIKILLSGRIQNDNYTNKNGEKVYAVNIICDELEFAESKKSGEESPKEEWLNIPEGIDNELPFM